MLFINQAKNPLLESETQEVQRPILGLNYFLHWPAFVFLLTVFFSVFSPVSCH